MPDRTTWFSKCYRIKQPAIRWAGLFKVASDLRAAAEGESTGVSFSI